MRTMYDSVTAADIPTDAQMVAGYVDGRFQWSESDWARFPNAVRVRIAIRADTDDGDVLDVEWGDASPEEVPDWLVRRRAAGVGPTVYVNRSNWQAAKDACAASGVAVPHWWLAAYGVGPQVLPGTVATQYADEAITGAHYDLSAVADIWPGVDNGGTVDQFVTRQEFEDYKVALQSELDANYARKDDAVKAHGHSGTVTVT